MDSRRCRCPAIVRRIEQQDDRSERHATRENGGDRAGDSGAYRCTHWSLLCFAVRRMALPHANIPVSTPMPVLRTGYRSLTRKAHDQSATEDSLRCARRCPSQARAERRTDTSPRSRAAALRPFGCRWTGRPMDTFRMFFGLHAAVLAEAMALLFLPWRFARKKAS